MWAAPTRHVRIVRYGCDRLSATGPYSRTSSSREGTDTDGIGRMSTRDRRVVKPPSSSVDNPLWPPLRA